MKIILLRNLKHVAPAHGTTSPHTGKPLSDISEAPPGYSLRTQRTLFARLPGSPCGGCNLVPGDPLSEGHTRCRPLELPHTRGEAASVCAGRR